MFREDDKKYVLIADITEGEEGGRVTVIPKGWIKKIDIKIEKLDRIKGSLGIRMVTENKLK